jgi:hypothetical protein
MRRAYHRFLAAVLVVAGATVPADGREEKILNTIPDRTWSRMFGGLFVSGKSVAVVISISNYKGSKNGGYPPLLTAKADGDKMVKFLRDDAGFDIIYVLTEESATKEKIDRLMIDEIPSVVGEHDRFLFYWSGHGDQRYSLDKTRAFGFLPLATSNLNQFSTMVSMEDIARWDSYLPSRHALFLLDSCLSGLAGFEKKSERDERLKLLSETAHHLITAGRAGENVISGERWTGSLFTDSFVLGAKGGAASRTPGVISLWSLIDYVQERVIIEKSAVNWGKSLTPQLRSLRAGDGAFFFTPLSLQRANQQADTTQVPDRHSGQNGSVAIVPSSLPQMKNGKLTTFSGLRVRLNYENTPDGLQASRGIRQVIRRLNGNIVGPSEAADVELNLKLRVDWSDRIGFRHADVTLSLDCNQPHVNSSCFSETISANGSGDGPKPDTAIERAIDDTISTLERTFARTFASRP